MSMGFELGPHKERCEAAVPNSAREVFVRVFGFGSLFAKDFVGLVAGIGGDDGFCGVEQS